VGIFLDAAGNEPENVLRQGPLQLQRFLNGSAQPLLKFIGGVQNAQSAMMRGAAVVIPDPVTLLSLYRKLRCAFVAGGTGGQMIDGNGSHLSARRNKGAIPADRDAVRLRDMLYAATAGDVRLWVSLEYVQRLATMTDNTCQAAVRRAAENGWITVIGRPEVHTLRMTAEGCRLARQRRQRA
jgi:hypothetical protein